MKYPDTMKPSKGINGLFSLLIIIAQSISVRGGTQFTSHVTVNTPARSFSHGVGDPITSGRKLYQRLQQRAPIRTFRRPHSQPLGGGGGYPRVKPTIPFNFEDINHDNSLTSPGASAPWSSNFMESSIPILPPSPYKVDSPDPESLWPEGLFLPPIRPFRFGALSRRADGQVVSQPLDPYLLEGSEAIAAVRRADDHGLYYFHDIPHIQSLLANQELRTKNRLKPHLIGSIRHTWPYNRA